MLNMFTRTCWDFKTNCLKPIDKFGENSLLCWAFQSMNIIFHSIYLCILWFLPSRFSNLQHIDYIHAFWDLYPSTSIFTESTIKDIAFLILVSTYSLLIQYEEMRLIFFVLILCSKTPLNWLITIILFYSIQGFLLIPLVPWKKSYDKSRHLIKE